LTHYKEFIPPSQADTLEMGLNCD